MDQRAVSGLAEDSCDKPADKRPHVDAKTHNDYTETIEDKESGEKVSLNMVAIPGGTYLMGSPAGEKGWFPHVLVAVRVRPGDGAIPADLAVLGGLNSFAMLAVLDHNRKHPEQPLRLRVRHQQRLHKLRVAGPLRRDGANDHHLATLATMARAAEGKQSKNEKQYGSVGVWE